MAGNTNKIDITSLDFDGIKESIKTYMNGQTEFQDYDFEGSGLNILMDMLAYNTSMNAYMANIAGNEMFLDSAEIRESVVSLGKMLNYTPRSRSAATATIDISITDVIGSPALVEGENWHPFTGGDYTFVTLETFKAYPVGDPADGHYKATDIKIYEGFNVEYKYTVDINDPDQRFIIQSDGADTTTLTVDIQKSALESNITSPFYLYDNLVTVNSTDEIFYLSENESGRFELFFGDDIYGKALSDENIVVLNYLVTYGKDANDIDTFVSAADIDVYSNITVSTIDKSYNGADKESIESIKNLAPRFYEAQHRAVTVDDYKVMVQREYPFIETVSCWGGEDNIPPQYGKVFFSIKPVHTEVLSESLKEKIKTELINSYNMVTVIPEIVDPDYLYVKTIVVVEYNPLFTNNTKAEIETTIENNISSYFTDTANKFDATFYYSPLLSVIDDSNSSIINSLVSITLGQKFHPTIDIEELLVINFFNELEPNSISSSYFSTINTALKEYLYDDGNGIIGIKNAGNNVIVDSDVGTVDYETGKIEITLKTVGLSPTLCVKVFSTPVSENITPGYNQIVLQDTDAENPTWGILESSTVTVNSISE